MTDRQKLRIDENRLREINDFLISDDNPLVTNLLDLIEKHGGVEEINKKANDARKIDNLLAMLDAKKSPYTKDLQWLQEQRDNGAFITVPDYRQKILGEKAQSMTLQFS